MWYQLHGSLDSIPVLRSVRFDPEAPCGGNEEAVTVIADRVRTFGAHELASMNIASELRGSIFYTPEGWNKTRMNRDLAKHPLINYKHQIHAVPTPTVPLVPSTDKRPLAGIKVVEIVRIIAGPVIGSTLAALGADVIRVNCSRLPDFNISAPSHTHTFTRYTL